MFSLPFRARFLLYVAADVAELGRIATSWTAHLTATTGDLT